MDVMKEHFGSFTLDNVLFGMARHSLRLYLEKEEFISQFMVKRQLLDDFNETNPSIRYYNILDEERYPLCKIRKWLQLYSLLMSETVQFEIEPTNANKFVEQAFTNDVTGNGFL